MRTKRPLQKESPRKGKEKALSKIHLTYDLTVWYNGYGKEVKRDGSESGI